MTRVINEENFQRAWDNQRLVAGALKAAGVFSYYSHYEDLMHDGILLYAQELEKWHDKPQVEVDRLVFRKIIWKTIDELRKLKRTSEHCTNLEKAYNLSESEIDGANIVSLKNQITDLSQAELFIFKRHLLEKTPITKLVEASGMSRASLQRIKKGLLAKLRQELL